MITMRKTRSCLAGLVLSLWAAGCSGSLPLARTGNTDVRRAAQRPSQQETLTSKNVGIVCSKHLVTESYFTAKGTASGPVPGAFTARGTWYQKDANSWTFRESFGISSRGKFVSGKIRGSASTRDTFKIDCTQFGPATLTYTAGSATGGAAVEFRGHLATQSLDDFAH
jgi:hypothetical protein